MFAVDGNERVVFTLPRSKTSERLDLWWVSVAGGDPTLLTRNVYGGDSSPDGQMITLTMRGGLWMSRSDGDDAELLVDGPVSLSRWSPDGSRILYADELRNALMVLDLETRESLPVPSAADGSDWLNDGTLIVDGTPD